MITENINRRKATQAMLGTLLATGVTGSYAQSPAQNILRLVVPFNPGGGSDQLARIIQQPLSEALKMTVIIENKPGAGGTIGAALVAKAPPDGTWLLLADSSVATIAPTLYPKAYASMKLAPVTSLAQFPSVLIAPTNFPANTLAELIALNRAKPRQWSIANSGAGTSPHLAAEALGLATKLPLTHVAYKGAGPAINDIVGAQVDLGYTSYANAAQLIQANKLKVLVVTSPTRVPELPTVPTTAESGFANLEILTAQCVFTAGGTPRELLLKLNAAIVQCLKKPDVIEKMKVLGLDAYGDSVDDFTNWINQDQRRWTKVINEAHVKVE